ncbi:hypothetical protein PVL29_015384 [Vitis rotundifolia]|uniref:Dirigent protein n=1 Tax=Vitis rotundifolia TaxID=103349 RepID=A0AA39DJD9_VITRO|nr:hypothetical protein PVL29_015384 [Vitis rotundifolia]
METSSFNSPPHLTTMSATPFLLATLVLAMVLCSAGGVLLQPQETNMVLYFQDYVGGPNATAMIVTGIPSKIWSFASFGTVFVTDDPITEAPDPNSAPVGRGRGMYITSALDGSTTHVLISIVFTNGQFSGSTLEIQGSSPQFQKYGEVSVVSGTGRLRFARGYAKFETVFVDTPIGYSVIKCNVTIRNA